MDRVYYRFVIRGVVEGSINAIPSQAVVETEDGKFIRIGEALPGQTVFLASDKVIVLKMSKWRVSAEVDAVDAKEALGKVSTHSRFETQLDFKAEEIHDL